MTDEKTHQADPRVEFFDNQADSWDVDETASPPAVARLIETSDLLNLSGGQDLLEVGCGTGKVTPWLTSRVAPGRVTAVDFAPRMLELAKRKGIDADFRRLDVCGDKLGSDRYDVIFCFHCFPHFRDQAIAVKNFARALKPEGRFIVMHLASSEKINTFHAGIAGAVRSDRLPMGDQWNELLDGADMSLDTLIDRDDLFFMCAR